MVTPGTGDKKKAPPNEMKGEGLTLRHTEDNECKEKEGGGGTAGRSRQGGDKDHQSENI